MTSTANSHGDQGRYPNGLPRKRAWNTEEEVEEDKLCRARMLARDSFPYFGPLLYKLAFVETGAIQTLGVSFTGILAWNRAFVRGCTINELKWALLHEIAHLQNEHFRRWAKVLGLGSRSMEEVFNHVEANPKLSAMSRPWNIAGDCAINQKLEELAKWIGEELPSGYVSPYTEKLEYGQTVEFYFKKLIEREKEKDKDKDKDKDNPKQNPNPNPPGDTPGPKGPGKGESGSAAGGTRAEWEKEIPKRLERDEEDIRITLRKTAQEIREHIGCGGHVPNHLKQWAKEFDTPPVVHWTARLVGSLGRIKSNRRGRDYYTFRRLNRRQFFYGIGPGKPIIPSTRARKPVIALVGDTSASMGVKELSYIVGTAKSLIDSMGAEVIFCAADTQIRDMRRLTDWSEAADLIKGRGGTDFRPAFNSISKMEPQPDMVVYVTDGDGPVPAEPDWCQVVWVLVGRHKRRPCKWGEFIEIEQEDIHN